MAQKTHSDYQKEQNRLRDEANKRYQEELRRKGTASPDPSRASSSPTGIPPPPAGLEISLGEASRRMKLGLDPETGNLKSKQSWPLGAVARMPASLRALIESQK